MYVPLWGQGAPSAVIIPAHAGLIHEFCRPGQAHGLLPSTGLQDKVAFAAERVAADRASRSRFIHAPLYRPWSWKVRPLTRLPSTTHGSFTKTPPHTSRSNLHLGTVAMRRPLTQPA